MIVTDGMAALLTFASIVGEYDVADWLAPGDPARGPCARCRRPCRRYGEGASPLCSSCRRARESQ